MCDLVEYPEDCVVVFFQVTAQIIYIYFRCVIDSHHLEAFSFYLLNTESETKDAECTYCYFI